MPHKSMVNRLIRTKLSAEAQWWIVGIDRKQSVLCSIPIFAGFRSYLSKTGIHVLPRKCCRHETQTLLTVKLNSGYISTRQVQCINRNDCDKSCAGIHRG